MTTFPVEMSPAVRMLTLASRAALLVTLSNVCLAQIAPKGHRFYETQQVGSALAREVAVGGGDVWAIGSQSLGSGDYTVMHLVGNQWETVQNGFGMRIAVDGTGTPWVITAQRRILRLNKTTQNWDRMPGEATEIAAGGDNIWVLGGTTQGQNNDIYKWNGANWNRVPGQAAKLSVSESGTAYVVNRQGELWRSNGKAVMPWVKIASGVNQINASINPAGAALPDILTITTTHDRVETKSNGIWYGSTSPDSVAGPPALRIARDGRRSLRVYAIVADPLTSPAGRVVIGEPNEDDGYAGPVLASDPSAPVLGFWTPPSSEFPSSSVYSGSNISSLEGVGVNWMSYLPDSTPLHKLSLPGTHDSGAQLRSNVFSWCQSLTDTQQLEFGIRFFDYRTKNKSGGLYIYHGAIDQSLAFDDVLKAFHQFLTAHPSEVVIMRVSKEAADDTSVPLSSQRWQELKQKYGAIFSNVGSMTPRPTLGQLRGKILFVIGKSHGHYEDPYNNITHPYDSDVETPDFFYQGAYQILLPWETGDEVVSANPRQKAELIARAFNKAADPANNKLVLNYLSGTGGGNVGVPFLWALVINPAVTPTIPDTKMVLGTTITDFPGPTLVMTILRTNFRFE